MNCPAAEDQAGGQSHMILRSLLPILLCLCACGTGSAQMSSQEAGTPQMPRQASPPVPSSPAYGIAGAQGPFAGGIPVGQVSQAPLSLTLEAAINRGLRQNLGLFLGEEGTRLAQAARLNARSGLLPDVFVSLSDASEQINLKSLGFSNFPGVAPIIGPFNVFDSRIYLSQSILNFTSLHKARAGAENLRAARLSYQDARDVVVLGVAGLYLQAVAGRARIDASRAQLNTAEALYRRAVDMKKAGVVPGIDVLRARVEMQAQQQRVIFFENEFEKQKLSLARAIGLPVGQSFTLADQMRYTPPPVLTVEQALQQALQGRADYRSALALVEAAESSRRAAVAERLPAVEFDGNYGATGPRPWDSHGTYTAGVSVKVPVFRAGRTQADILQADSMLQQRKAELADLRNAVEEQIRASLLDLKAAADQVAVATSTVSLAAEQLKQAEDRFAAGVADNIEVVQAQEAVATANENDISALFSYNLAKASLARALGGAEKTYLQFLRGAY
jgi:outer membrane protein TolC